MLRQVLLAAALLVFTAAANAVTIDSPGDTFTVSFDGNVETQWVAGLTASATFVVTEFDAAAGRVVLEIALETTADASLWQSARVSALGFDVDEEIATASAGGLFDQAVVGGKFPNRFGPVDVCVIDNRNNCSGGGHGGVEIGESGGVTLTLAFGGPLAALELSNFGVRYQSLSSDELRICDGSGTGTGTVPEPRVLALLGAAGLALLRSRCPRRTTR